MNWPALRSLGSTFGPAGAGADAVGGGAVMVTATGKAAGVAGLPASAALRLMMLGSAAILSRMLLVVSMSCSGVTTRPFLRSVGTIASTLASILGAGAAAVGAGS